MTKQPDKLGTPTGDIESVAGPFVVNDVPRARESIDERAKRTERRRFLPEPELPTGFADFPAASAGIKG